MAANNNKRKPATAFSVELSDYKKDELIVLSPQKLGDEFWAIIKPNIKDNNYGFKGDESPLPILCGTGLVKDGHTWLLFTTKPEHNLFEFEHKIKSGDWSADEAKVDEYYEQWISTGCLTALLCDGYKQLEVLAQNTIGKLFSYSDPELIVSFKASEVDLEASKQAIEWSLENGEPTKQDFKKKELEFLSIAEEQNTFPVLLMSEDDIDTFCSVQVGSGRRAEKTQFLIPCEFDFETLPELKSVKFEGAKLYESQGSGKRGGYGGSTTVNVNGDTAQDRLDFILKQLGVGNAADVIHACNDSSYRQLVNFLLSISGATFPLTMTTGAISGNNLIGIDSMRVDNPDPLNLKSPEVTTDDFLAIIDESDLAEEPMSDEEAPKDTITPEGEPEELTGNKKELVDWINTQNGSSVLPKDLDLVSKDEKWCGDMLTLLEGKIGGTACASKNGIVKLKSKVARKALVDYEQADLNKALELLDK